MNILRRLFGPPAPPVLPQARGTLLIQPDGRAILGWPDDATFNPARARAIAAQLGDWLSDPGSSQRVMALPFPVDVQDQRRGVAAR